VFKAAAEEISDQPKEDVEDHHQAEIQSEVVESDKNNDMRCERVV
jgi:hypothetical protein